MINPHDIKIGDEFESINSTMSGWFEKYTNCKVIEIKVIERFSPNERGGVSKIGNNFVITVSFEDFRGCFKRTDTINNTDIHINDFENFNWEFCKFNELYSWEDY